MFPCDTAVGRHAARERTIIGEKTVSGTAVSYRFIFTAALAFSAMRAEVSP